MYNILPKIESQSYTLQQQFGVLARAYIDTSGALPQDFSTEMADLHITTAEYTNSATPNESSSSENAERIKTDAERKISRVVFRRFAQPFHNGYSIEIYREELAEEEDYEPEMLELRSDPIEERKDCFFRRIPEGYVRVEQMDTVQEFMDIVAEFDTSGSFVLDPPATKTNR